MLRAALLCLALAAPAAAQAHAPLEVGPGGRTWCEQGRPVSALNPLLDSVASRATAAHEAQHRRQLAVHCDSTYARLEAEPARWLAAEAEALCAGVHAIAGGRASRTFAGIAGTALLLGAAFPHVPSDSIAAVVGRACTATFPKE